MAGKELPKLHVVTDDEVVARDDFLEVAHAILAAGAERVAFHLRAPRSGGRAVFRLAEVLASVAASTGSPLIVNDRADVAVAAGAAGVHLGARGLPPEDARRLLGPDRLLGASVHTAEEAHRAALAGADYLLAGTLYDTPSHPGRRGSGPDWLREAARGEIPVIGIGGVTLDRVPEVVRAGAWGVAVIRGVWNAEHPREAVRRFIEALY
ncbi:MAG TPA: thiamine phosphate synthase [Longimicrobiaceae bacterium]